MEYPSREIVGDCKDQQRVYKGMREKEVVKEGNPVSVV